MTAVTRSVRFTGRVQGINFRRSVMREALAIGVRGWISNQPDGSVTGIFAGEESNVENLIRYCLTGIPLARIDTHEIHNSAEEEFDTFRIL